jgi:hypothetical protein
MYSGTMDIGSASGAMYTASGAMDSAGGATA